MYSNKRTTLSSLLTIKYLVFAFKYTEFSIEVTPTLIQHATL